MKISISSSVITINGNIKSIDNSKEVKNIIEQVLVSNKNITLNIIDSISLTSSIIIYLKELALKEVIYIQMYVGEPALIKLLDDLKLISIFRVKKGVVKS